MPLVLAIFEVLGRPAEDNDQAAALEKQMLRRSYFTFIQTVTGSGMNEVMANQGESGEKKTRLKTRQRSTFKTGLFSGPENIERVVFTIIQGAVDFPDPIAQKTCFIILSKLVELWGEEPSDAGLDCVSVCLSSRCVL